MTDAKYTHNLEEIITHGLEQVDPDEKIEVNLKDLLYTYGVLQEYMRFFHQPEHYQSLDDVITFLGSNKDNAGFQILSTAIYEKMSGMFPAHIYEKSNNGDFDSPQLPFYYDEKRHHTVK
ncbi:hypothetical protein [Pectobacterium versatile]|uniref:hypothetical protein n=1 Tax=Pectobacterium versatile TaxID=2488639 RepID=UPI001CC95F3D|nr:hypothetical protein [Pectobacterium versatile]